ncbi:conserved unknown protein [Ectocarpus siliculosus]|uniref:MRN complex-interacting protein N-terminal domain-containing protein n=1 Tax=Ectocarpus siliculosus TaxID=2880 RepID=D8LE90_ECTSI|nr:conserved unknown protein [Ectocarpus siliculosus]|eukprot:CBN74166.1 conserved unknown protein [Ectocarpus siliculosus]
MEGGGIVFLALRCFSCQCFQVNQRTKSGKWKCRMCGEGQSIVKVWGRGGHAKDVRGLVMALNAAAGGGEDLNNVLRNNVGGFGPQSQSRRHKQDGRNSSDRIGNQDGDRAYSTVDRAALQHTVGPAQPGLYGRNSSWARPDGFVPACVAPIGDEHDPAVGSWHVSGAEKMDGVSSGPQDLWDGRSNAGYPRAGEATRHPSDGFGTSREHHPDVRASWQPGAEPAGGGGRSGSRWGAFASNRATEVLEGRRGPNQEALQDPDFVTCLETAPARRRASPTPGKRGRKRGPPSSSDSPTGHGASRLRYRRTLEYQQQAASNYGATADSGDAHGGGDPQRQQNNVTMRRDWPCSSSSAPGANQDGDAMAYMRDGGWEDGRRDPCGTSRVRVGVVEQEWSRPAHSTSGHGGMSRDGSMFPSEWNGRGRRSSTASAPPNSSAPGGTGVVGATSGPSSSSRWSKFVR